MKIGTLRHRIKIQAYNASRDSFGSEVPEWVDVTTVWASMTPVSGKEYMASSQMRAEVTTKIGIRYQQGVTPKMRVVCGTRIFDIISVLNLEERNIELQLLCKERVQGG